MICDVRCRSGLDSIGARERCTAMAPGSSSSPATRAPRRSADETLQVLAKPFTAADLERVLAEVVASPQTL